MLLFSLSPAFLVVLQALFFGEAMAQFSQLAPPQFSNEHRQQLMHQNTFSRVLGLHFSEFSLGAGVGIPQAGVRLSSSLGYQLVAHTSPFVDARAIEFSLTPIFSSMGEATFRVGIHLAELDVVYFCRHPITNSLSMPGFGRMTSRCSRNQVVGFGANVLDANFDSNSGEFRGELIGLNAVFNLLRNGNNFDSLWNRLYVRTGASLQTAQGNGREDTWIRSRLSLVGSIRRVITPRVMLDASAVLAAELSVHSFDHVASGRNPYDARIGFRNELGVTFLQPQARVNGADLLMPSSTQNMRVFRVSALATIDYHEDPGRNIRSLRSVAPDQDVDAALFLFVTLYDSFSRF